MDSALPSVLIPSSYEHRLDMSTGRVTDMAIEDALVVLTESWDDVMARMDAESRAVLAGLLKSLGQPSHQDATARIADLLVSALPQNHPVRRALTGGALFAPATLDWPALAGYLRQLLVADTSGGADTPGPTILQD
jgi:hypothetical protein